MKNSASVALAKYFLSAPRCGAKTKRNAGKPCLAPAMKNGRCRMHGGKSTGPKTIEGKLRAANAHVTHGLKTKTARAQQELMREMMRWRNDLKEMVE